jgi:2-polyprenyl-3-methyl-5-hydroxy-6-metoxy-1,4-benzoquinol methylase
MAAPTEYWNHNTAYHPWLVAIAAAHRGDVLDVGCGDGLLAQRLAPVSRSVTGIDPDAAAIGRAADRLATHRHVTVTHQDFHEYQPGTSRFDLIAFVASLHHMDLRASLIKARELLTPTGELAVVGCHANKTVRDWIWAADDVRRVVSEVLPGASVRRGLYYRYLLRWRSPESVAI